MKQRRAKPPKGSPKKKGVNSPKKAKQSAKPADKRAVPRAGGGTKYCRGCKKKCCVTLFQVNQELEQACKKDYDRLWKIAHRQGQLEWLRSVYHDDDRLYHLLTRFREQTKGNAKKFPFKVAEYKEKFCQKAMIINDDAGEMFEEEEFVTHMCTRSSCH